MAVGSLGTIWAEIGVNIQKLDAGLMAANLKLATADKTIMGYGQKLTAASTKMMIAGGLMVGAVAAVGIASVKMAAQFETSMRNVNSISKLSETQFKALGQSVINMSKKFPQTAKELADGLYDISSSGFAGAEGLKVLEAAAMSASAGMTDTATSAKGITAVLNAFGFEADQAGRVADTMFKTVDKGVITFEELSGNIGEAVGTANIAGIGFEELSGMIAYMTTKGIGAAETMTSLNRMMLAVITPTDEMTAVLNDAGFASGQLAIEQIGLSGVMDLVAKAANGDVAAIRAISGDMRAFKAVASLTGSGIEELNSFMEDFSSVAATAGSAAIALAEQEKALNYQLQILKNNATAIAITLGNKYIPAITSTTKSLSEWISENEDATVSIINLGMKVGTVVGGILLLGMTIGKLRAILLKTGGQIGAIIAAFAALNIVVDMGADKLEDADTVWGTLGGTLLRTLAPLTATKKGLSDNIIVAKALADGIIELSDVKNLNIFTMGKMIEKIEELRAAQEESKKATEEVVVVTEENRKGLEELYNATDIVNIKLAEHARQQRENKSVTEENTDAQEEQVKTVDELRGAYNSLISTLFDGINATNTLQESEWAQVAAQEAVNKLVKEGKEGTQEYEQAVNELDSANQSVIESLYGVYTSTYTTKEEQEEARKKALEYGQQLVTSGQWGEEAYESMAAQFSKSTDEVINPALDTVQEKLDIIGETVATPKIKLDTSSFDTSLSTAINRLNALDRRMGLSKAMGGIVGYDTGGIVGMPDIPQAASGMVVPQMGRSYLIQAEEYEDVVNTSQQRNLAEWIMGKANSRPDTKGGISSQEVILHIPLSVDGKVLYDVWEKYDLRKEGERVK